MDKLQPLIKHKFWIIAGLVLLVPFIGWWINTSSKAAYIQQRWDTLAGLTVTGGSNTPNEKYIEGIENVNKVLDKRQKALDTRLYESQKNLHTWPKHMADRMEGKQFGDPLDDTVRRIYRGYYQGEVEELLRDIPQYQFNNITLEETGLVDIVDVAKLPFVPEGTWKDNPPTSEVAWNTEEDIWLTRAILEAVKKVNKDAGATKISDAPIRMIFTIQLRGGSRGEAGAPAGGTPAESAEPGGSGGMMATLNTSSTSEAPDMGGGEGMYGNTGSSIAFDANLKVDLDSVLGPAGSASGAGGGSGTEMALPPAAPGGSGGVATQEARRYVDDDPKLPYKTRGFYIEVLMLHDKLPDFQAALVSMPWPTELLMIHQVSNKNDDIKAVVVDKSKPNRPPVGGGGYGAGSMMEGGMPSRFVGGGGSFGPMGMGAARFGGGGGRFGGGGTFGGESGGRGGYGGAPGQNQGGFPMDGMGGNGSTQKVKEFTWEKAMKDFYLTKVGIAGLMTIYRSPQEMAATGGTTEQTQPAPETQPDPSAPMNPNGTAPLQPGQETPMPGTGTEPKPMETPMPGAKTGTEPKPMETPMPDAKTGTEPKPMETPMPGTKAGTEPKPMKPPAAESKTPMPKPPEQLPPSQKTPAAGEPKPAAQEPPKPKPAVPKN